VFLVAEVDGGAFRRLCGVGGGEAGEGLDWREWQGEVGRGQERWTIIRAQPRNYTPNVGFSSRLFGVPFILEQM
jgi:hypothetical protein